MKSKKILVGLSIVGLLAGLCILLFPAVSNRITQEKNSIAISSMTSTFLQYDPQNEEVLSLYQQAHLYNQALAGDYEGSGEEIWTYAKQLSFQGAATMGYLEISKIDVHMLIYHGTSEDSLSSGVGHLEGTSLPVGGESTHSVLVAHTGMQTMKAFDDLLKLEVGDSFSVTALGSTCEYEVYDIETVLPDEIDSLKIQKGKDLVTLVTCTPYGLNSHRLLVHGKRVLKVNQPESSQEDEVFTAPEEPLLETHPRLRTYVVAGLLGLMLLMQFVSLLISVREMKRR